MQVDHVVIVAFLKDGDLETEDGSVALLNKYRERRDAPPRSCHLVHVHPIKNYRLNKFQAGEFEQGRHYSYEGNSAEIDAAVAESDNVGVYLLFHGGSNSQPHIFGAQTFAKRAGSLNTSEAGLAVAQVLTKLGLRKVRKLCLLMCNGATGDNNFIGKLCAGLKTELDSPPMVAGWDCFISLQLGGQGKKIQDKANTLSDAAFKHEHKMVYVCTGENYEKTALAESGWSDKAQLPTKHPTGCVTF